MSPDETFWDALEASQAPIFASHSSCRALSNARRNMSDDMIKALAKKGGVIQINFACDFLNERVRTDSPEEKSKLNAKFGDDEDELRAYVEESFRARNPCRRRRSHRSCREDRRNRRGRNRKRLRWRGLHAGRVSKMFLSFPT